MANSTTRRAPSRAARPNNGSNGINDRGGPVMTGANGVNVYYIWYGNWGDNTAQTILPDFAQNIGGSPYFKINTTYYDSANKKIVNRVNYGGAIPSSTNHGVSLSDAQIKQVVSDNLAYLNGGRPDPNGAYFVLTSSDVTASSGFCTQYCGWHTHGSIAGVDIKYSFVGNPDRCRDSCSMQQAPNGNVGADGMASVVFDS
jgi:hypothetical protein